MQTTIKLSTETKSKLDLFREYKNESYDEVLNKVLEIVQDVEEDPELSQQDIKRIQAARKRIQNGNYVTEEEMSKRLGIKLK